MITNKASKFLSIILILFSGSLPALGDNWFSWVSDKPEVPKTVKQHNASPAHFWWTVSAALVIPASVLGWKWYEAENKKKKDVPKKEPLNSLAAIETHPMPGNDARNAQLDKEIAAAEIRLKQLRAQNEKKAEHLRRLTDEYLQGEYSLKFDQCMAENENPSPLLRNIAFNLHRERAITDNINHVTHRASYMSEDMSLMSKHVRAMDVKLYKMLVRPHNKRTAFQAAMLHTEADRLITQTDALMREATGVLQEIGITKQRTRAWMSQLKAQHAPNRSTSQIAPPH